MSRIDVVMPQMGESIAEGTVTKWLKQKGDEVKRDESLLEISTDKVDADIPSPASGTLVEILTEEGTTVEVGSVIARIETEAGKAAEADGAKEAAEAEEPEPEPKEPAAKAEPAEAPERAEPEVEPTRIAAEAERPGGDGAPQTREERLRTRSTPLVRRIAAEHDVDLTQLEGSGYAGRVTKKDIMAFLERREEAPARRAAPAAAPGRPGVMHVPIHGETLEVRIPEVPIRENDRVEEMSVMRQRIMEHMLMSRRISAHVSTVFELDFERVARIRKGLKPRFEQDGVRLTYLPFILKAVVEGLKEYPVLNSSVVGRKIVYHGDINVGIAVALDEGKGLIVPVIKNADELSLLGLARRSQDLGERARGRKLTPDDVQGGTFTITNPGVFGSLFGMPIINQPQVAILGVGMIEKRPVVVDDAIAIRHRAYFGISYDHRVVDGAMCDFFMNKVKEVIEDFPEDV
jgi:2-oxoglutarate dehydrogenase E2 component (dihydrolipoamide succinyltransferase)